jgi:iron(III) transport system substrate-binding protein
MRRPLIAALALALSAPALAGCGLFGDDGPYITVYNAQHEELIEGLAEEFTEETGIKVRLSNGKDFEKAQQLVQEGDASPADVFLTENSPAMSVVDNAGLLAPLEQATLDRIPAQFRPADGAWLGFAARSTVVVYNKEMLTPDELPGSILDFAKPEWKGRIAFSPTGADFQAIVSAVLALKGEAAAKAWLEGLKANGSILKNNLVVLQSVNDGQVAAGIEYHYYWYRDQAESGDNSNNSDLYFFGQQDPGAFVSISGAGILKSSEKQTDAKKFLDFLVSERGQQELGDSYALEYPLRPGATLPDQVKPFSELQPPTIDYAALNGPQVIEMMQEVGFL